jgi:hypothetical protein
MQDPETGMFFEEIGGGGQNRFVEGMTWWYENHSGCYADNSQNYFTDNILSSGDERIIRVQYNPIVQYINQYILLRASNTLMPYDNDLAVKCIDAASRSWHFTERKKPADPLHLWTSVRAWRLCAGNLLFRKNIISADILKSMVQDLCELFNLKYGFWFMDIDKKDMYRGIQHSAQPIIALCQNLDINPAGPQADQVKHILCECRDKYITLLAKTNPFGIIPYGTWFKPATEGDIYREFNEDLLFRFFMPDHSPQKINHGLSGHWMSWAHGLALLGKTLHDPEMTSIAWNQIYWEIGGNNMQASMISGVGFNNPMPHSRFFGTCRGGFCVGPRGNDQDAMMIDMDARAEWNSTEYWNAPLANALMALSILLHGKPEDKNLLGFNK